MKANQSQWISVKDRLPDTPGAPLDVVLDDLKSGYYDARYTDNHEFVTRDGELIPNVAYWQPVHRYDEILKANKEVEHRI